MSKDRTNHPAHERGWRPTMAEMASIICQTAQKLLQEPGQTAACRGAD